MPYPSQTFANFAELLAYFNSNWIVNGNGDITGLIGNNGVNGLLTFIEQSPLNYQTAQVISTGGIVVASRPVTVFITNTPTSLQWGDNIYNEFIFVNTTDAAITITGGIKYYDIDLVAKTSIPAKSILSIAKSSNGLWISINATGDGSGVVKPLIKICTEDGADDTPISGSSIYENIALAGLGASNDDHFEMVLNGVPLWNFGQNPGFEYIDAVNGIVDISLTGTFSTGDGLYVNLNQ